MGTVLVMVKWNVKSVASLSTIVVQQFLTLTLRNATSCSELNEPQDHPRHLNVINPHHFFCDTTAKTIGLTKHVKKYGLVFDKRVLDPDTCVSVPFEYVPFEYL